VRRSGKRRRNLRRSKRADLKLVVGLGNPGKEYKATPHNAGFAVVEDLAGRFDVKLKRGLRFRSKTGKCICGDDKLMLVEPLTFMNRSGDAVSSVMRYNKIATEDLILVLDDADLPAGRVRIRPQGSSGGHRGLDSVIGSLGTKEFVRIRVGIGRGSRRGDLVDFVLSPLRGKDADLFEQGVKIAADAVQCIVDNGVERAMNEFNGMKPEGDGTNGESK
jgi:PTH1 family peptidyl-tRNA hydrolase